MFATSKCPHICFGHYNGELDSLTRAVFRMRLSHNNSQLDSFTKAVSRKTIASDIPAYDVVSLIQKKGHQGQGCINMHTRVPAQGQY